MIFKQPLLAEKFRRSTNDMEKNDIRYQTYINILKEELVP